MVRVISGCDAIINFYAAALIKLQTVRYKFSSTKGFRTILLFDFRKSVRSIKVPLDLDMINEGSVIR